METFWDTLRACADLLEDIDAKRASDLRYIADRLEERAEPTDTPRDFTVIFEGGAALKDSPPTDTGEES